MLRQLVIALMLFGLSSSANASLVLKDYKFAKDQHDAKDWVEGYLSGVMEGVIALNRMEGRQPIFCLPPNLSMRVEQAEDIMMREAEKIEKSKDPGRFPVSLLLIFGLKDTFPCDEKH